nr:polyadenylate binding protein [Hymenolepis microstoma]
MGNFVQGFNHSPLSCYQSQLPDLCFILFACIFSAVCHLTYRLHKPQWRTSVDAGDLRSIFAEFGETISARVAKNEYGNSKAFVFACFSNPDSAKAAVNALNNRMMDGERLYVSRAQSKLPHQQFLSQAKNLHVHNLDDTIDDAHLKEMFSRYGDITSAKVMLTENEEARKAINVNGSFFGTKPLYVGFAQPLEERRAMLLAENHQKQMFHQNGVLSPHTVSDFSERIPANTPQPSNLPDATTNPPLGGIMIWLDIQPNLPPLYVGGPAYVPRSTLTDPQFHGQADAYNEMLSPMSGLVIGHSNSEFAGQQYDARGSDMFDQMLGITSPGSFRNVPFVSSNTMSEPIPHPNVLDAANSPKPNFAIREHASISVADETENGGECSCLTDAERQAFGNEIYRKIARKEPYLAIKLTEMILQMSQSFVRNVMRTVMLN